MASFEFWTHGVGAVLEPTAGPESTRLETHRTDIGTVVENDAGWSTWIHLPIPTPTILEGRTALLRHFRVAVTLNENARLEHIHVRSGILLLRDEPLSVVGATLNRTFDIDDAIPGGLGRGLAISFLVAFLTGTPRGRVELHGAGALFS